MTSYRVNRFFLNVRSNESIDRIDLDPIYLGEESYDDFKFYWKNLEDREIYLAICSIKSNVIRRDEVPLSIVSLALPTILYHVHIFNFNLMYGVFPFL